MPQKNANQKSLLKMLDESILAMKKRVAYLKGKYEGFQRAKEQDKASFISDDDISGVLGQLESAGGQLDYLISMKKELEEEINRLKDDEKRKERMEYFLRCAYMIGIITENRRIESERDTERDHKFVRETNLEETVKMIFEKNHYKYVTPEMIQEIINDPEFKEMAEKDPDKLVKEEADIKEEYDQLMEQAFRLAGMEIEDDFDANEAKLKKYFEEHNGYRAILDKLELDRYSKFLEWGGDADREFMAEMKKIFKELEAETKTLEQRFITGESDFKKGNGYTKKLIETEQKLLERITVYRDSLLNDRIMKKLTAGEVPTQDELMLYELTQTFVFPITEQLKRDVVFMKNNAFRKKLEMWDVYKKLPEGQRPNILNLNENIRLEGRAWSKIQRMGRLAAKKGGLFADTTKWSVQAAQLLLEDTKKLEGQELTEEKKKDLKEKMAILVVNRLIYNEAVHAGAQDDSPYTDELRKDASERKFKQLASDMAASKEFRMNFDDIFKNCPPEEIALRFLAKDIEKEFARRLPQKVLLPEKRQEERVREAGLQN
ncbi:MAG: hypothetical protein K5929_03775 [Lachnospiraceae bacterium]|nr:hypothetical protein [Lachnospiraceae bacterium]